MRLQWKYSLIINLTVIAVLVAFFFFDSIRMRKEMSALHALGAEQSTTLKKIAENTILKAVVGELNTSQAFSAQRIDKIIAKLKKEHQDMKDVMNVQVTLGDSRVRSSLLAQDEPTNFNLGKQEIEEIETKEAIIDTIAEQSATSIIINYSVQPKRLELTQMYSQTSLSAADIPDEVWQLLLSKDFDLPPSTTFTVEEKRSEYKNQIALNQGKFPFELWRMLIANQIYLSPDATVKIGEQNNRWQITDLDSGHKYNLWQDENAFWIHIAGANTGYIRVLFDVPYIAKSIRSSLLMHAIFIVIVGVLLVVLIFLMTNYMIMKPLARMTEIIQNAESGNFSSYLHRKYASDEISKATRNLVRMFLQLKTSHSRKIAALGQFAAGIAHEIRNPLNSIGMTAQHLKTIFSQPKVSPEDIDEAIELLDIVDEKIGDLKQTSEQFLTLNRPRKLHLTTVNLNELLDSVLSEFILIAEEANVQIIKSYTELPNLQLDEMLMHQTIFNIVQNSIQAMPKGGSVYITTTFEDKGSIPNVMLEIRDTGIGIPEENQELIYDAYFTTKESDGGVGLGLAISHQTITAHQGKVEVKSKVGMGTAFNITLPIKSSEI
ncbi:HAMP domain-containing protein [Candidatus Poribacteria bacterium]|nr:HAMP domain-containing protein [Candidatus Poribacteria bacterium]